jgi:RNA polymerase sigma factor (sigma-70 family)
MTETSRDALRRSLVIGYEDLKARLSRHLGSAELAGDALQETYLRLSRGPELAPVRKPRPYLLRMAIHIALRLLRNENSTVSLEDAKAVFDIADEAPGPYSNLEARVELEAFRRAVAELTPRRRVILYASRFERIPLRKIAERLGISQRLVEIELKHALAHCALRLDREIIQRFGPKSAEASMRQKPSDGQD